MARYLDTVFRHRLLLVAPVVIALAVAFALTAMQPRQYQTAGNLWFDPAPNANPYDQTSVSEQNVETLKELLLTQDFDSKVGKEVGKDGTTSLAGYLTYHVWNDGSVSSLFSKALTKLGLSSGNQGSLDSRVSSALGSGVAVAATGPDIVNIQMTAPDATVAAVTVQAIMDQFSSELLQTKLTQAQTAVDADRVNLQGAQTQLANAKGAVAAYVKAAKGRDLTGDAQLAQLNAEVASAQQAYDTASSAYDQASLNMTHIPDHAGFRVIDAPAVPAAPIGFTKKLVSGGFAGLFIGLVVSVLCLVLLTVTDATGRSGPDVERRLGATVIGTVRDYGAWMKRRGRGRRPRPPKGGGGSKIAPSAPGATQLAPATGPILLTSAPPPRMRGRGSRKSLRPMVQQALTPLYQPSLRDHVSIVDGKASESDLPTAVGEAGTVFAVHMPEPDLVVEPTLLPVNLPEVPAPAIEGCRAAIARMAAYDLPRLGVTSTMPGEGRSSVAYHLAWLLARDHGRRTLLLELECENPVLADRLGLGRVPGLAEMVRGTVKPDRCIHGVADNLFVLPAGTPPENAEAAIAATTDAALSILEDQFDIIVADLPSLAGSGVGLVIERRFPAMVLVLRAGVTPVTSAREAVTSLSTAPAVLLNGTANALPRWVRRIVGEQP